MILFVNLKKKKYIDIYNKYINILLKDIEERVGKTFPTPIDKWALTDARDIIDKSKKKKSVLPVDRVHTMLQKVKLKYN